MERQQALEMAVGQIEKQYGKGSIMRLGERGNVGVEAIPTGALALDLALGTDPIGPPWTVTDLSVIESDTRPTGAVHTVRDQLTLGGP